VFENNTKLVLKRNRFDQQVWMLVKEKMRPTRKAQRAYNAALDMELNEDERHAKIQEAYYAMQDHKNRRVVQTNVGWFFSVNGQIFFQYAYALQMADGKKYQASTKLLWLKDGIWMAQSVNADRGKCPTKPFSEDKKHIEQFIDREFDSIVLKSA
jgi:hypothetical protein